MARRQLLRLVLRELSLRPEVTNQVPETRRNERYEAYMIEANVLTNATEPGRHSCMRPYGSRSSKAFDVHEAQFRANEAKQIHIQNDEASSIVTYLIDRRQCLLPEWMQWPRVMQCLPERYMRMLPAT